MKRFLVFFGLDYYPSGGMEDFIGDCDTMEDGKELIEAKVMEGISDFELELHGKKHFIEGEMEYQWGQIYDTATRQVVYKTK